MKNVSSKSAALLGLVLAAFGGVAQAQSKDFLSNPYLEVGYMPWSYTEAYSGKTYTWDNGGAIRLIFGMDVHDNVAVEALYATDVTDPTVTIGTYSSSANWASTYGVYALSLIHISEPTRPY